MGKEIVYARKYRPQCLEDLIGQEVVVQTLTNAFSAKKLHHAYLFVGQFGSGKTTAARILAAMENCEESPGLHPCGQCSICKAVFDGKHTDIMEIDAASDAGNVKQIRELKREVLYNCVDGAKVKYIIIDEAHRMSEEAKDSLLKTLEEPPARVRFILCTTDVQRMKSTIISRCQRHDFIKIFWTKIVENLDSVAKQEGLNYEPGALPICAKLAQGSMRNALNNLQKASDLAGKDQLTATIAQKAFGGVEESAYFDLVDELLKDASKSDTTIAFRVINKMLSTGAEYQTIASGISNHLDSLIVGCTSGHAMEFIAISPELKPRLKDQLKMCKDGPGLPAIMESLDWLSSSNSMVEYGQPPETAIRKWFIESLFAFRRPRSGGGVPAK